MAANEGAGGGAASPCAEDRAIHPAEHAIHEHLDPHRDASALAEVILGGQDGLVNVLGVVLGVAAATQEPRVVLTAGLAATFAESVAMGGVAYTSVRAEEAFYDSEQERERRHVALAPELERCEVREIFRKKGFEGTILERIVETITSDEEVWVGVMMREEHGFAHRAGRSALRSALIVGVSALVGSLIPLLPFAMLGIGPGIAVAIGLSVLALFVVGGYKARTTVGTPWKSGLEMAAIGLLCALAGYGIGLLLQPAA
jgi:VIT1/CCC1 family predicted Fe2+/Mn2+ transporter